MILSIAYNDTVYSAYNLEDIHSAVHGLFPHIHCTVQIDRTLQRKASFITIVQLRSYVTIYRSLFKPPELFCTVKNYLFCFKTFFPVS